MVEDPGNRAFPSSISPMIQPSDHISTPSVYDLDPISISGDLNHLVATYSVKRASESSFSPTERANPKSASFAVHSESNRIFAGFRSLQLNSNYNTYGLDQLNAYSTGL